LAAAEGHLPQVVLLQQAVRVVAVRVMAVLPLPQVHLIKVLLAVLAVLGEQLMAVEEVAHFKLVLRVLLRQIQAQVVLV
jgi:hypothetical protein